MSVQSLPARLPRLRLPQRTIRLRLTVLYGAVSVLSAAVLLAITITLWRVRETAHVPPPVRTGTAAGQHAALRQALAQISELQALMHQADVIRAHQLLVAGAGHGKPLLQVVFGDLLGGGGDRPQWAQRSPGDEPAKYDRNPGHDR